MPDESRETEMLLIKFCYSFASIDSVWEFLAFFFYSMLMKAT